MYRTDNLARLAAEAPDRDEAREALDRLYGGESLAEAEAEALFAALVEGRLERSACARS